MLPSKQFPPLNLKMYPFKIIKEGNYFKIFDEIRKNWVILTPEEWVRQHILSTLIVEKKVPKSLIQVEYGFEVNGLQKRADIICFNSHGNALLIVECKAASVPLTQQVVDQISRYNVEIGAPFLLITNGLFHILFQLNPTKNGYVQLEAFPELY